MQPIIRRIRSIISVVHVLAYILSVHNDLYNIYMASTHNAIENVLTQERGSSLCPPSGSQRLLLLPPPSSLSPRRAREGRAKCVMRGVVEHGR